MAVINTFSAGMPSNIGTWNLRTDNPAFRITANQRVGGAVELYFSTTAGRINWDYWTLNNPDTRFPKWFLEASTFISHPKSQCAVTINFPISTVMVINFGAPGANLPPPNVPTASLQGVLVTASGTPWSTATTMLIDFISYGDVCWLRIPGLAKNGDTNTPHISFTLPGGVWPAGFRPMPGQRFPFHGVYPPELVLGIGSLGGMTMNLTPVISLETTPADSYNLIRINAPCTFGSSGWDAAWTVVWPSQTFCYLIDRSV